MKVRKNFVTNSSSTNYVISFSDKFNKLREDEINESIKLIEQSIKDHEEYYCFEGNTYEIAKVSKEIVHYLLGQICNPKEFDTYDSVVIHTSLNTIEISISNHSTFGNILRNNFKDIFFKAKKVLGIENIHAEEERDIISIGKSAPICINCQHRLIKLINKEEHCWNKEYTPMNKATGEEDEEESKDRLL